MMPASWRAHFASAEQESERYAAAQRLGELIERREQLLKDIARVEGEMQTAEAQIKAFD